MTIISLETQSTGVPLPARSILAGNALLRTLTQNLSVRESVEMAISKTQMENSAMMTTTMMMTDVTQIAR